MDLGWALGVDLGWVWIWGVGTDGFWMGSGPHARVCTSIYPTANIHIHAYIYTHKIINQSFRRTELELAEGAAHLGEERVHGVHLLQKHVLVRALSVLLSSGFLGGRLDKVGRACPGCAFGLVGGAMGQWGKGVDRPVDKTNARSRRRGRGRSPPCRSAAPRSAPARRRTPAPPPMWGVLGWVGSFGCCFWLGVCVLYTSINARPTTKQLGPFTRVERQHPQ